MYLSGRRHFWLIQNVFHIFVSVNHLTTTCFSVVIFLALAEEKNDPIPQFKIPIVAVVFPTGETGCQ